ncbi:hypothetical protein [Bradyrhizobium sp.]|uniref:hypothetical protein n=1 Tax=Bradyrhizobium sp. TaxID=376 RepID=UPI002616F7F3|nr:hypothetical protein [Bradyrhizobium sp.]
MISPPTKSIEEEKIARCVAAADELALFFAGLPDAVMSKALAEMQERMNVRLTPIFDAGTARAITQAFVEEVARRRHALQTLAPSFGTG